MAQLEAEIGRELTEDETSTIALLADQMEGFDPQEIKRAVHRVVNEPADPERQVSWSELREHLQD